MNDPAGRRFAREIRFLQARFSPEGYLGLHLTLGLLVILAAGWWFGDIAEDVSRNSATRLLDVRVASWFHQHATSALTQIARIVTFFGSVWFIAAASVCTALILIVRRARSRLLALATGLGGGSLVNILLKHFFHRQRPVLENPLVTLSSFGFPSGHTMGATLFYGLLSLFVAQAIRNWRLRLLILCTAALCVAIIGLSRIYLGAQLSHRCARCHRRWSCLAGALLDGCRDSSEMAGSFFRFALSRGQLRLDNREGWRFTERPCEKCIDQASVRIGKAERKTQVSQSAGE